MPNCIQVKRAAAPRFSGKARSRLNSPTCRMTGIRTKWIICPDFSLSTPSASKETAPAFFDLARSVSRMGKPAPKRSKLGVFPS
jgi:hypothetical protein